MAEGVVGIRWPLTAASPEQEQQPVAGIDHGVNGL